MQIGIIGPESTGKSELTLALQGHYEGIAIPEYARKYLEEKQIVNYTYADVIAISEEQKRLQEIQYDPADLVFFDTTLLVNHIWMQHAYGEAPYWLLSVELNSQFDLYLVTNIDLPWVQDPLREHPQLRAYFFDKYIHLIQQLQRPYAVISGVGEERVQFAIECINKLMIAS